MADAGERKRINNATSRDRHNMRMDDENSNSQSVSTSALGVGFLLLAAGLQWLAWMLPNQPVDAPELILPLPAVAYHPTADDQATQETIAADLALVDGLTQSIRTYDVRGVLAEVPRLAAQQGLRVSLGVWVTGDEVSDEQAVRQAVQLAERHPHIERLIIGNESLLRGSVTEGYLRDLLKLAAAMTETPVTTAEPWDIWIQHPELAESVDHLAVHILPYWEGDDISAAIPGFEARLALVREAFPEQSIWVGEVGWPSAGPRSGRAIPSQVNQALYLRQFSDWATQTGLTFSVIEAFDQPWKRQTEGVAGSYWGLLDQQGQPKFSWNGEVVANPHWHLSALLAMVLGLLLGAVMLFFVRRCRWPAGLFAALFCQLIAAVPVLLAGLSFAHYLLPGERWMLLLLVLLQLPLLLILFAGGFEFAEVRWRASWSRQQADEPKSWPRVSIHMPVANESPKLVCASLDKLAQLDYPSYEVLVIFNNCNDPTRWQPAYQHGEKLGFRCEYIGETPGFKAGALNYALGITDPDAEVIAILDCDYQVDDDWLRQCVGHFQDTGVAVVQSPQAHREASESVFNRWLDHEYHGFFVVGMHHRNQRNAIIQHGTMSLVRREAMEQVGGWEEHCICEDAELGLRLLSAGYQARYLPTIRGRGVVAADFRAYCQQRFRWAFGAMQILRMHFWRLLRLKRSALNMAQRYHFLTGWSGWFADALHLVYVFAALLWTGLAIFSPKAFLLPGIVFLLPPLVLLLARLFFGYYLYRYRTGAKRTHAVGASLASMSLSHTVARAIWMGLFRRERPFGKTRKSIKRETVLHAWGQIWQELSLALALVTAMAWTVLQSRTPLENWVWAAYLVSLALPYCASVLMATLSAMRREDN